MKSWNGFSGENDKHRLSYFPSFEDFIGWYSDTGILLRRKGLKRIRERLSEVTVCQRVKKQLERLNKVKKAKAEELTKLAASGSDDAKKKLKKLQKKIK